jgi:hypothetical protein
MSVSNKNGLGLSEFFPAYYKGNMENLATFTIYYRVAYRQIFRTTEFYSYEGVFAWFEMSLSWRPKANRYRLKNARTPRETQDLSTGLA